MRASERRRLRKLERTVNAILTHGVTPTQRANILTFLSAGPETATEPPEAAQTATEPPEAAQTATEPPEAAQTATEEADSDPANDREPEAG